MQSHLDERLELDKRLLAVFLLNLSFPLFLISQYHLFFTEFVDLLGKCEVNWDQRVPFLLTSDNKSSSSSCDQGSNFNDFHLDYWRYSVFSKRLLI